ncbi:MAG: hypothetical protein JF592_01925 [Microbacterium sp.]|uniref:hypothetical protein n=1 Tax=Microbacterium sp. TaxID=51671 RepID=UPI001D7FCC6D|nr:hypothetical protein [Microbacterium sp.]MBW8761327.1 hypothetical protein [Microbacterium sp.]
MSTDDEKPEVPVVPRTRAELRAARAAAAGAGAEAAASEPVSESAAEDASGVDTPDVGRNRESIPRSGASTPGADGGTSVTSESAASVAGGSAAGGRSVDPAAEREAAMRAAMVEAAAAAEAAAREAAAPAPDRSPRPVWSTIRDPFRPLAEESPAHPSDENAPRSSSEERSDEAKRASPASTSDEDVLSRSARSTTEEPTARPSSEEPPRSTTEQAAASVSQARTPSRRFLLALTAVLGVLVVVGAALGFVSLTQGPRITNVQVAPAEAIESSGSRVILTANQALSAIDASQVTVEPAVPFTVDAAGRGIGIRFTVPLDDSTKYAITVADVESTGGGPSATLKAHFTTPASSMFILRRDVSGKDTIFLTDLSGENAVPVYSHDKIDDFRATSTKLVVSVEDDDLSKLYVMDRDGKNPRELKLPGKGYIGSIQVSERGGLVGYTYSDKEISEDEGRASVLVTQSLSGGDKPKIAEVGGEQTSILVWQFVPDSAAMLFIDFNGALSLIDHSTDAGVQSLGLAANIQGISRGTYTAVVERVDGSVVELNLADGSEQPLAASNPDYGSAITIVPFPGGTLRHVVSVDATGYPNGQAIIRVDDAGTATSIVEVGSTDSILQACASPSGQYAAVAIAPDLAKNAYDQMLLPLPENVETHLLDLRTGKELVALTGFDSSWCATAPHY